MKSMKLFSWLLLPIILGIGIPYAYAGYDKIGLGLQLRLNDTRIYGNDTYDIIVEFNKSYITSRTASIASSETDPAKKAFAIKQDLMEGARKTQAGFMRGLQGHGARQMMGGHYHLWLTNEAFIVNATKDMIVSMAEGTGDNANITMIRLQKTYQITGQTARQSFQDVTSPWSPEKIGTKPWINKGFDGTGVVIGHIDTGVDWKNPMLADNWIGPDGGWLDPFSKTTEAWDSHTFYHGTKTLAVAVGKEGVGVAPGARWISCLGCYTGGCMEGPIKMCAQFMFCPLDVGAKGSSFNKTCLYRPRAVLCPWGRRGDAYQTNELGDIFKAWKEVDIIPVFSAGNNGASSMDPCNTILLPADNQDVLTVGGVDKNDSGYYQSSWGPPENMYSKDIIKKGGIYKPEFVAPADKVYTGTTPDGYPASSGTSFAAAHVVGSIALLLSRSTRMTLHDIMDLLQSHAQKNFVKPYSRNKQCGEIPDETIPNHKIGYGRLNLPDPDKVPHPVEAPTEQLPPVYRGGSPENWKPDPIKSITTSLLYIFLFVIL